MNKVFIIQSFNFNTFTLNSHVIAFLTQKEAEDYIKFYNKDHGPSIHYSYAIVFIGKWNLHWTQQPKLQIKANLVKAKDVKKEKTLWETFTEEEKKDIALMPPPKGKFVKIDQKETAKRKKAIRKLNTKLTNAHTEENKLSNALYDPYA